MEVFGLSPSELTMIVGSGFTILTSIFGAAWALVKRLIFDPLDKVNTTLGEMKTLMAKGEERIEHLEKSDIGQERRLTILEQKIAN